MNFCFKGHKVELVIGLRNDMEKLKTNKKNIGWILLGLILAVLLELWLTVFNISAGVVAGE